MLIAIGPDVTSIQDYTTRIGANSINIQQNQGDTLDTMKCVINDPYSQFGIGAEDELHVMEETDPNGWPTTNLLLNPNFSGTYNNGGTTAANWGIFPNPSPGVTLIKNTTGGISGGTAQQISIINMSTTQPTFFSQTLALPQDEFNNPLAQFPYYFSIYINQATAISNLSLLIRIEWYDKVGGTDLGSSTPTLIPSASNQGYIRYWTAGIPVSGATVCTVIVRLQGTSATNSGVLVLDNAQFEYATFSNYQAMGFPTPLQNQTMNGTLGNSLCTNWAFYNSGSTVYSVISAPPNNQPGQEIILTNATAGASIHGIQQSGMRLYISQNYTLSMTYYVTAALTGGTAASFSLHQQDKTNVDLGAVSATGPSNEPITNVASNISLRLGPNTPNPFNANAQYFSIHLGLVNTAGNGTNSGTVVITSFTMTPDSALKYAGSVGIYPTPYCDGTQPGCYLDTITGKYYRQWRYFAGYVKSAIYDYSASGDRYIEVDAVDFSILLQEAPATILILGMKDTEAINAACVYAHNQGFLQGLNWTTNVANIATVNAMLFNWRTTRDVLTEIANQTVAAFWVDPYKNLWYQPALATTAPFGLSDQPDATGKAVGVPTYPMAGLRWNQDSTETVTAPVIEGSTQISAPQTFTGNGSNSTTTADLNAGAYNYLKTTAITEAITQNTAIYLWDGTHFGSTTAAQSVSASVTSIPISTFKPSATIGSGARVGLVQTQTTAALNSGTPYTSVPVNALTVAIPSSTNVILNDGTHTLQVTTSAIANVGATSISIGSVTPSATIASGANVAPSVGTTTISLVTTVTSYSSISVAALPDAIAGGSDIIVSDGTTSLELTVASGGAAASATSIALASSFTPTATVLSGATVAVVSYVINNANPIAQIDSVTVNGVAQGPIGLKSTNTYSQGFTCLVDLQAGELYFQNAPASGSNNVVIIYRYASPVIVRITVPTVGGVGAPKRKIHSHQKEDHITSQQAAIDRANAELEINAKAKPVGDIILLSPPTPFDPGLHAGQAIQVWFAKANQAKNQLFPPGQLFQIQACQIQPAGNGVVKRTLKIGFYQPDFGIYMAQIQRDNMESTDNNNTVLQDVLSNQDFLQITDSFTFAKLNTATWYSGSPASNSYGWGPVSAPRQQGVWG